MAQVKLNQNFTIAKAADEQALIEGKTTILSRDDFLPETEVALLAGVSSTDLSALPNIWKRNRDVFTI